MKIIRTHKELDVYKMAIEAAMEIFEVTKSIPKEEIYYYPVKYMIIINSYI